jgi:hypothetical protein
MEFEQTGIREKEADPTSRAGQSVVEPFRMSVDTI